METLVAILVVLLAVAMIGTALYFNVPEKIFGANWRTSSSTYFTAACAFLYVHPEYLHSIPQPWQDGIWRTLEYLIYAGIVTIGHTAKDKQVTGGTVVTDGNAPVIQPPAGSQSQPIGKLP